MERIYSGSNHSSIQLLCSSGQWSSSRSPSSSSDSGGSHSGTQGCCGTIMIEIQVPFDWNPIVFCYLQLRTLADSPRDIWFCLQWNTNFSCLNICIYTLESLKAQSSALFSACNYSLRYLSHSQASKYHLCIDGIHTNASNTYLSPELQACINNCPLSIFTKKPSRNSDLHTQNQTLDFPQQIWLFFGLISINGISITLLDSSPCFALNI